MSESSIFIPICCLCSSRHGRLDHLIYGLELGNEVQDIFTAAQQATNFAILHNLTMELWPDASRRERSNGLSPRSSDAALSLL